MNTSQGAGRRVARCVHVLPGEHRAPARPTAGTVSRSGGSGQVWSTTGSSRPTTCSTATPRATQLATVARRSGRQELTPISPGTCVLSSCLSSRVNVADSNSAISSPALSMRFCAEAPAADLVEALTGLRDDYLTWVEAVAEEGASLGSRYHEAVERHVDECRETCGRLGKGITLLARDADSLRAFRLANQAMRISGPAPSGRVKADPGTGLRTTPTVAGGRSSSPSSCCAYAASPIRRARRPRVADLLWFPTGGGKTEAYLGLIAFTIFLRRLRREDARRRRDGPDALHAAAAHDPAVRARGAR